MKSKRYDDERLGLLLRLLRSAPARLVARAKRIPLAELDADDLALLARQLDSDSTFKQRFDADPLAALESAELRELTEHLRVEWEHLLAAPEEWLDEIPEVVAHGGEELEPELRLRVLLLESTATRAKLRA
jgi:hypothetical protein